MYPRYRLTAAIAVAIALLGTDARAWSTDPWNAQPFDAPVGATAAQLSKIAKYESHSLAQSSNQQQYNGTLSNTQGCNINLGNVAVGGTSTPQDVATNVTVHGDVINICR